MTVHRLAALALLALALAGCGSSSSNSASSSPARTTTPPPAVNTTTPQCASEGNSTAPRASPALQHRETMYLTNVAVQTGSCADHVVFDFEKGTPGPGFEVSYEPAAAAKIEDGSGKHVDIAGTNFLVVRLAPAMTAKVNGDKVEPTYSGPRRITPAGARQVQEVVKTGDFENQVTWAIGLTNRRPFTTNATSSQLVVTIG